MTPNPLTGARNASSPPTQRPLMAALPPAQKQVELPARRQQMDISDTPFITMPEQTSVVKPTAGKPPRRVRGVEQGNRIARFHGDQLVEYGDNLITTSKYTWYSFFPRSLFEQ